MTQKGIFNPGLRTFATIWFGQLVSILGSGLTQFSLAVWVFEETGSVTRLALILLFSSLPGILLFPVTGVLVDRWDRRWVLIGSDSLAALATLAVVFLLRTDQLTVWHIYVVTAVISVAGSFQWPAFSATITMIVPQEQLGRVGGLMQFNGAAAGILAPLLAGILLTLIQLENIVLIDVVTFLVALLTLALVRIPNPEKTVEGSSDSIWREALYGWQYIKQRQGLTSLLVFFAVFNLSIGLAQALFTPLILSVGTTISLGSVSAVGSAGMLIGSMVMSAWGGPKRRIHGVLGFTIICGFFIALFGVMASIPVFMIAAFGNLFATPIINASNQAIWQSKVAPDVQGRVFSTRSMIGWSTAPVAYLLAGPLADRVFEPLLVEGGVLANTFIGQAIGVGPGRGIALLYILVGLLPMAAGTLGYLYPRLRLLEDELPNIVVHPTKEAEDEEAAVGGELLLEGAPSAD